MLRRLIGTERILYAIGGVGLVTALAGEIAGSDVVAGFGYLVAVVGLFGGFLADRRKRP